VETNQHVMAKLNKAGFKLTNQRRAIVKVLLEKQKDHLSAEEVYHFARKITPEIGLATVYRTMDLLVDLQVVDRISFKEAGMVLYDLRGDRGQHFHSHLICDRCGDVLEVEEDIMADIEPMIEEKFAFKIFDHQLTIHGLCQDCLKRGES